MVTSNESKDLALNNLKDVILIDKKIIRKERRKKNFWKTVTVGLAGLLIYQTVK